MKKSLGLHAWLVIIIAALLVGLVAAPAGAGNFNRKLYGDYSANFMLSCGSCSLPFTTTPLPLSPTIPACLPTQTSPAPSSTYTWNAQGIYTFDGKGTAEFTGRYLVVLRDPMNGVLPVILPQKLQCEGGIYTVSDDLTFKVGFESCKVTIDSAGNFWVHDILNVYLGGQILDRMDGPILLLTDTLDPDKPYPAANIEQVINYDPSNNQQIGTPSYRICGMTGTAIPVKGLRIKRAE